MAMEQTLWFFKADVASAEQAIAIARALENRETPATSLHALPMVQILAALQEAWKRKLKIDARSSSAELDLPARETHMLMTWTPTAIEAIFDGDADNTIERFGKILARFNCGCVYGNEYHPPEAPINSQQYFYPDLEAQSRIFGRIRKELRAKFPGDPKRQEAEFQKAWHNPVVNKQVQELADQLEANYRQTKRASRCMSRHERRNLH